MKIHAITLLLAALLAASAAGADDALTPGKLIIEPPTLICLGFQWHGSGDANHNATAKVEYRRADGDDWKPAQPLMRVRYSSEDPNDVAPLLAGSIFDLQPGTDYQVRLTLSDPDGVHGQKVHTLTTSTRGVPKTPEGGEVRHLYPPGHKGPEKEPAFHTLLGALRGVDHGSFGLNNRPATLEPGDTLIVHAGIYKADRYAYRDKHFLIGFGTYFLHDLKGAGDKPITIKSAGDGEVIFDGAGCWRLFDTRGARNVIFEGLTIRNTEIAFWLGDFGDRDWSEGITIRDCVFRDVQAAVIGRHPRSKHFLVTDCRMFGRGAERAYQDVRSNIAVNVGGKGHSICYNYADFFFDFYDGGRNGEVTYSHEYVPGQDSAIDIYNNHLHQMNDNAIGTGDRVHNIRVMRNLIVNNWQASLAPYGRIGGPVYWFRNIVHNNKSHVFKFHRDGCISWHNTANTYDRSIPGGVTVLNSLYFSSPEKDKQRICVPLTTAENVVVDGNAYVMAEEDKVFARVGRTEYKTIDAFQEATGLGEHSMVVSRDAVKRIPEQWLAGREFVQPEQVDLTPAAGSPLIDAAVPLANVNDDYAGDGPDIGALEAGKPAPHWGPRTKMPSQKVLREPEGADASKIPADPGKAVFRVNCGSTLKYEDPDGAVWLADQPLTKDADWGYTGEGGTGTRSGKVAGAVRQHVYARDRFGMKAYRFEVPAGAYIVRLHFAEGWFKQDGQRIFDVAINGRGVLDDFDIHKAAGGRAKALCRDFHATADDKGLTVSFAPVLDNPSINGIEVFKRP
jgi:hypothetical protein